MNFYSKMIEEWRNVECVPGLMVSNIGGVRRNGKILTGEICGNGYHRIHVSVDGESKKFLVHRLVAEAFLPNPENKPQVNHIDGDKLNNRAENLEWCDASENLTHAYRTKLRSAEGVMNGKCKLTEEQVIEIRKRYVRGKHGPNNSNSMAREFGVSPKTILKIVNGVAWTHLFMEEENDH